MLHRVTWWAHTAISPAFIAYIPYSRFLHILTTSSNHFLASLKPAGSLEPIRDFETAKHSAWAGLRSSPEADIRCRRLHALRTLPGRVPGLPVGKPALPEEAHSGH